MKNIITTFCHLFTARFPYLLRMMASDMVQSQALISFVERMGWEKMAILTSDTDYGKFHSKLVYIVTS